MFRLNFLTLILSVSPNVMHFVCTFSIMRADVRLMAIEEVRSYGQIVYIKNIFENDWLEDAYFSSYPPGSAPGHKQQMPYIFLSFGTISFVLFF